MSRNDAVVFYERFSKAAHSQGLLEHVLPVSGLNPLRIWTRRSSILDAPVVVVSSGIHGDEQCGPEALVHLMERFALLPDFDWIVAPLLNPSGYCLGTRENGDGIDLNRDFFRREAAETRAFIDWWSGQGKPCAIHFSLHEDWEAEGFYLYEISTSGLPSMASMILDQVAGITALQSKGPVDDHELTGPGLIVHPPSPDEKEGWPEAIWISNRWPVCSYTFEAPGRQDRQVRVECLITACMSGIQAAKDILPSRF